jgi:ABC-2 type transport system ATP-binding protein
MSTIVDVQGLSKRFILHKDKSIKERLVNFSSSRSHREDFWALRDIDLRVETGSTLGLVGHNGSGRARC